MIYAVKLALNKLRRSTYRTNENSKLICKIMAIGLITSSRKFKSTAKRRSSQAIYTVVSGLKEQAIQIIGRYAGQNH